MKKCSLNQGWKFYLNISTPEQVNNETKYDGVNIPHTWNAFDGQDGGADYLRTASYYEKTIDVNKTDDKDYYLEFDGVNSIAKVYLNNEFIGEHKGGFSRFRFKVTDKILKGMNTLGVICDNSANEIVYPQTADFTFFGGIYRDVNLIETTRTRFDLDYYGGNGVKVTPILNKDNSAIITVNPFITNPTGKVINAKILFNNELVLEKEVKDDTKEIVFEIKNPVLWNGIKEANLYHLDISLLDNGLAIDKRDIAFGIRSFTVDKDGFYLNGKKYELHGVSRHQDRLNKGWAISKEDHKEDMELIKEIGATTIRLAHYQHDQYFYDLCDEAGMVVWAEIPCISVYMETGDENAFEQMKELIVQNYNHPSICFWGLSNEITIGGNSDALINFHIKINDLVHQMDKTRLTTLAAVTMCDIHEKLLTISDVISYNHYFGWYLGDVEQNATWLDNFRKEFPDKPLGLSEYGCEANLALHSEKPTQGDYSEEYQAYYHERMLEIFKARPWLWSTHCWNMFDFAADQRDEGGVKGRNNKGLVTYDRKIKKDSFYLYKAYWSDEPFVHVCGSRFTDRKEKEITIKVYSSLKEVSLYRNDKLVETKTGEHVFEFKVPVCYFGTKIKAVSGEYSDEVKFRRVLFKNKSYKLKQVKGGDVVNWFEKDGVKYEMEFPKGKFNIDDKFGAIYKTEEGKRVLLELVATVLKEINPEAEPEKFLHSVKGLVGGMTIRRIAGFAGGKIDGEMLYHINEKLTQIDRPTKG